MIALVIIFPGKKIKFLAHLGPEIQKFEKNNIFQKNLDPQNISNFLASKI